MASGTCFFSYLTILCSLYLANRLLLTMDILGCCFVQYRYITIIIQLAIIQQRQLEIFIWWQYLAVEYFKQINPFKIVIPFYLIASNRWMFQANKNLIISMEISENWMNLDDIFWSITQRQWGRKMLDWINLAEMISWKYK